MPMISLGGAPGSRLRLACCLLVIMAMPARAEPDTAGPMTDEWVFDVGSYFMASETGIRFDGYDGLEPGTRFRIEDVFSLDDEAVFRLEGAWRFKPRHSLRVMYFDSSRTNTQSIDQDIDFGDASFPMGSEVTLNFRFTVAELAYRYSLMQRENFELGGSIGVHNIRFKAGLGAMLAGSGGGSVSAEDTASTKAPLPVVGLNAAWRLRRDFYLLAHGQFFQLKYQHLDGGLEDYQAGLLWQFSRHVGVGAAYNMFRLDVTSDDPEDFRGRLDWKYYGPQLFMRANF